MSLFPDLTATTIAIPDYFPECSHPRLRAFIKGQLGCYYYITGKRELVRFAAYLVITVICFLLFLYVINTAVLTSKCV